MATSNAQSAANIQGLVDQGYTQAQINSFDYGDHLNPTEAQQFVTQAGPSGIQQAKNKLSDVASQEYAFDPQKYLPGIQSQAEAIFSPQKEQLEALRQLQASQASEAALTTEEAFDDQLTREIESINNRGAFFGGGAIEREQDLGDQKLRALNQIGLQASAADFSNLAQQGLLGAEESQFIQDRLYNAEAGAYSRFTDQRNFSYGAALQEYQIYEGERNFARDVFESDRQFKFSTQQAEQQQANFKKQFGLTSEQFDMAKEEFNVDMKIKGLSYEKALDKFKSKYDTTNYINNLGDWKSAWEASTGGSSGSSPTDTTATSKPLFNVNDFLTNNLPEGTFNEETNQVDFPTN